MLRIVAYARVIEAESIILISDLIGNLVLLCGRVNVNNPSNTKTYNAWLSIASQYSARLMQLLAFAMKKKIFYAANNLAVERVEWAFQATFISHIVNNWNKSTLRVDGSIGKEKKKDLSNNVDLLDRIEKMYEAIEDKENLINCLILKYELLHFADDSEKSGETLKQIQELIEISDFNGLKSRYERLVAGDTRYQRFVNTLAERIMEVRSIAKESGLEEFLDGNIPDELLEYIERDITWTIDHFLEFRLPEERVV